MESRVEENAADGGRVSDERGDDKVGQEVGAVEDGTETEPLGDEVDEVEDDAEAAGCVEGEA